MPSKALATEGCTAINWRKKFAKATDGKPQGLLSVDFFLLAKISGVKRSGRRMPSIAQRAAEGCAAANCDNRSTEATDNVLHLYFTQY